MYFSHLIQKQCILIPRDTHKRMDSDLAPCDKKHHFITTTGLEPATYSLLDCRSNQLSYAVVQIMYNDNDVLQI